MTTVTASASGQSYTSGSAGPLVDQTPMNLSSYGASQSSGAASLLTGLPLGGLVDIGIWGAGGADPAMTRYLGGADTSTSGRAFIAATAPSAYVTAMGQLWPAAVYAAVRGTWTNTYAGTAITNVQVEALNAGNQLPPDAVDYRTELVYTQTAGDAAVSRVSGSALCGSWCGQLVNSGTSSWYTAGVTEQALAACAPGQLVCGTVSLALPRTGATWTAGLSFFDANYNRLGSTWYYTAYSTHPGSGAWQSSTATYTAPSLAAWVAVVPHVQAAAIGDGETALMDCHRIVQVTPALAVSPSTFSPARQQNVTIVANRINQALNPSFTTNTSGWGVTGGGAGTAVSQDPAMGVQNPGSLKLVAPHTSGSTAPVVASLTQMGTRGIALLVPGRTYTCSVFVAAADQPEIHLQAVVDGVAYPGTTTITALADSANVAAGFSRLAVTVTLPVTGSGVLSLQLYVAQADWAALGSTVVFDADDVLVEEGALLNTYFDGSVPSPDYVWEGTAFLSRSHYYRDYRALQYRLNGLVQGVVPLERPFQLLFAQPGT